MDMILLNMPSQILNAISQLCPPLLSELSKPKQDHKMKHYKGVCASVIKGKELNWFVPQVLAACSQSGIDLLI